MNNYEYGFITKCAEYNIDPEKLIKAAGWFTDDNAAQEAAASKVLVEKARSMGVRRYNPSNLPGTVFSRRINKIFRSEPGYRNYLINQGEKELQRSKNLQYVTDDIIRRAQDISRKRFPKQLKAISPEAGKRPEELISTNQAQPASQTQQSYQHQPTQPL